MWKYRTIYITLRTIFKETIMKRLKTMLLAAAFTMTAGTAMAGGILHNTTHSVRYLRMMARDGAIAIDGVYYNPAGVAFLPKGWHFSFSGMNVYQTRTIFSGMNVQGLEGTPYYQPFKMFGGDENGVKKFKGTTSVPIMPAIQVAKNYDKWGFQGAFGVSGGGGKCTFNDGLGSFERTIAMIPAMLYKQGMGSRTPSYSVDSYVHGQQYVFGLQLGATYKVNDNIALYGGMRFNYSTNEYEGSITNITAKVGDIDENLYNFFGAKAETMKQMAFYYKMRASEMTNPEDKAKYDAMSKTYEANAKKMDVTRGQFADKYLDCTQSGWGITPIIGVDLKYGNLNIGAKYEFKTNINMENKTKVDDTGMFKDGVNTPGDLPALLTVGAEYSLLPSLRLGLGYHLYFDKDSDMDKDKQKELSGNSQEFVAGVEYDINKYVQVSCGWQYTHFGLGEGGYMSDMSYVLSSNSIGFGAGYQITKNTKINVAYMYTWYNTFDKSYTQNFGTEKAPIMVDCTDKFKRTNKVFGVGVEVSI